MYGTIYWLKEHAFPRQSNLLPQKITTPIITIIEKQLKGSAQILSQAEGTDSSPDFNKPGTLRVGTASKIKNMGTDLGKKRFKKSAYPNLQTKLFNTSK